MPSSTATAPTRSVTMACPAVQDSTCGPLSRKYPGHALAAPPCSASVQVHARHDPVTCWAPPCSTAAAIASPTCPTCTMRRWGIEEMYKISKQFLRSPAASTARASAWCSKSCSPHFNLIAMTRLFTNRAAPTLCQAARQPDVQVGAAGEAVQARAWPRWPQHLAGSADCRHSAAYVGETLERGSASWVGHGSAQAAPQPLVPAALAAAGPEIWSRAQGASTTLAAGRCQPRCSMTSSTRNLQNGLPSGPYAT